MLGSLLSLAKTKNLIGITKIVLVLSLRAETILVPQDQAMIHLVQFIGKLVGGTYLRLE